MSYQSTVLADTPIGYWRMETTSAYNEVTTSNNTLVGTPTIIAAAGALGNGWSLDGNQAINLGGSYTDFTSDNTWTIECWFKRDNAATADDGTIWRRDGNGKAALIRVASNDVANPGKVRVYLNAGVDIYSPSRVDDNNWHHLVVTANGTGANAVKMYIDGSSVQSVTGTNLGSMTGGTQAIGAGSATVGNSEAWVGGLSDVAIYDYALSLATIGTHYNEGIATVGVTIDVSTLSGNTAQAQDVVVDFGADLSLSTVTATAQANDVTVGLGHIVDVSTVTATAQAIDPEVEILAYSSVDIDSHAVWRVTMSNGSASGLGSGGTVSSTNNIFALYNIPAEVTMDNIGSAELHYNVYSRNTPVGFVAATVTGWNSTSKHLSTTVNPVTADDTLGQHTVVLPSIDLSTFDGVMLDITSGTVGISGTDAPAAYADRPFLRVYYVAADADVEIVLDSTPSATAQANDAVVEIHDPLSVEVTLSTVTTTVAAHDASFEEIRTVVLTPTFDTYRAQGASAFTDGTNTLSIAFNPSTPLSSVLVPTGTTAQIAMVNLALERFDFPVELVQSALTAKWGRNYIPVVFNALGDPHSDDVLGTYNPSTGVITIDTSIATNLDAMRTTLFHEFAHALDDSYVTNPMRLNLWNAMHDDPEDYLPTGTVISSGVAYDGHYWLGGGSYLDQVGEGFANAFVRAYSDSVISDQYTHDADWETADEIRSILTPTMAHLRGPFPSRTPAARFVFAPLPGAAVTGGIVSATLKLNVVSNTGGSYFLRTLYPDGRFAIESSDLTTTLSTGVNNIDITSILDPTAFERIHLGNVKTTSSQTLSVYATESSVSNSDPQLTLRYTVAQGATLVDLDTPTISEAAYDVTVEAVISPDVTIDVDTAVVPVFAGDALVVLTATVNVDNTDTVMLGAYDTTVETTDSVLAVVDSPRILVNRIPLTDVNGEPIVPSESEDPYFVTTMRNLEGGVQRVFGGDYTGVGLGASEWFRMDTSTNGVFLDRAVGPDDSLRATLTVSGGVEVGLHEGPEGRHNVHFDGASYAVVGDQAASDLPVAGNVEFTIRTERSTQFLIGGLGRNLIGGSVFGFIPAELWMVDGYLEAREYRQINGRGPNVLVNSMRGHTKIDDGEWHHIVWQSAYQNIPGLESGVSANFEGEFYVDGELDVRRRNAPNVIQRGLFFGGRVGPFYVWPAGGYYYAMDPLPSGQFFLGDMTELVLREARTITADDIHDQRDAMFGIIPVKPDAARITTTAYEASSKGNKPRHLVLDFGKYGGSTVIDLDPQIESVYEDMRYDLKDAVGAANMPKGSMTPSFPGWGPFDTGITMRTMLNVRFYPTAEQQREHGGAEIRDEVTDNYRLLDLDKDINMDDYDIISIMNYPGTQDAWDIYSYVDSVNQEPKIPMRNQVENLMAQVKEQVIEHGKGLFLSDPMSAIELGIIDRVEWVPSFEEHVWLDNRLGAVTGTLDWHSYVIDPFNGAFPSQFLADQSGAAGKSAFNSSNRLKAARYMDVHSNIKQRVRNTIDGLTTQPSNILTDYILWQNVNPMAEPPYHRSLAFEERPIGLNVGDEFYMICKYDDVIPAGFAAAPVANILVGKPVTTFSQTFAITPSNEYYQDHLDTVTGSDGRQHMDADIPYGNPYYNHAVSIAIEPGDAWDGQAVTGKVYVNFTETFVDWADEWTTEVVMAENGDEIITPEGLPAILNSGGLAVGEVVHGTTGSWTVEPRHMKYNFSTHYGSFVGSEVHIPDTGGSGPDWGWSPGGSRGSAGDAGGAYAMNYFWHSTFRTKIIEVPTMAQRAARWLMESASATGNVLNGVETATSTAHANDVVVETQKNEYVDLSTARADAEAINIFSVNEEEIVYPDVSVGVPTVSVVVRAHSVVEDIVLETATVEVFPGNIELQQFEVDWDNAITLTMPNNLITLILEDA